MAKMLIDESVLLDPHLTHFVTVRNYETGFWESAVIYRGQRFDIHNARGTGAVMKWLDQCVRAALKA